MFRGKLKKRVFSESTSQNAIKSRKGKKSRPKIKRFKRKSTLESLVFGRSDKTFLQKKVNPSNKKFDDNTTGTRSIELHLPDHSEDDDGKKSVSEDGDEVCRTSKRRRTNATRQPAWRDSHDAKDGDTANRFGKIVGNPSWAVLGRKLRTNDDATEGILRTTGDYLTTSVSLVKGALDFKQCADVNKEKPSKGCLRAVEFHPTAQVILVAGIDQTVNLFQVDGKRNAHIQSIYMEQFPILTAHFSCNGEQVIMGSKHKSFAYYDMIAGRIVNVPHIKGLSSKSSDRMGYFDVSPDGEIIVFRGRDGLLHLVSAKSKEWISTMKMNGSCNALTFNSDGRRMYSFGSDGDVYVWDMTSRQCVHKFADDGCLNGTAITQSKNNQYLVTGSSTGVVNVYDAESCMLTNQPRPMKSIMNLTTTCNQVKFNHTAEILAIASERVENAVKLVHFPSMTVFHNYPEVTDITHMAINLDFSLHSGYLSIAAHTGRALLYRLKHFSSY